MGIGTVIDNKFAWGREYALMCESVSVELLQYYNININVNINIIVRPTFVSLCVLG